MGSFMDTLMNPAEFANIANCERDFWWFRGMRKILFRLLDRHLGGRPPARVLEAGCGTGYLSWLLQQERHWPVVPMDISPDGLRYARGMGAQRAVQGDVTGIPFAGGAFDLVLSIDVLAHLPRGREVPAAREMARVLAPGGLLVVRTAALDILRSRHSEFAYERQRFTRRRLAGLFEGRSAARHPPDWNRRRGGSTGCCTRRWRWRLPGSAAAAVFRWANPCS
jgi:SAM-dependent methyltransferase